MLGREVHLVDETCVCMTESTGALHAVLRSLRPYICSDRMKYKKHEIYNGGGV